MLRWFYPSAVPEDSVLELRGSLMRRCAFLWVSYSADLISHRFSTGRSEPAWVMRMAAKDSLEVHVLLTGGFLDWLS